MRPAVKWLVRTVDRSNGDS